MYGKKCAECSSLKTLLMHQRPRLAGTLSLQEGIASSLYDPQSFISFVVLHEITVKRGTRWKVLNRSHKHVFSVMKFSTINRVKYRDYGRSEAYQIIAGLSGLNHIILYKSQQGLWQSPVVRPGVLLCVYILELKPDSIRSTSLQ